MTHVTSRHIVTISATTVIGLATYLVRIRPWANRRGATDEETARAAGR